jgi:hypothetical protein
MPKRKSVDSNSNSDNEIPVKIRSQVSNVKKKQVKRAQNRIKHSNFIFTINTNQRVKFFCFFLKLDWSI